VRIREREIWGHRDNRRGAEFYPSPRDLKRALKESPYQKEIINYFSQHGVEITNLFHWPRERRGLLSDIGILRHFLAGNIVIDPFNIERLQTDGYDVSLGKYYFVYHGSPTTPTEGSSVIFPVWKTGCPIFNPLDKEDVSRSWGEVNCAQKVRELSVLSQSHVGNVRFLEGYRPEDRVIFIEPGQMILGHTEEFIGGQNVVSTTISGKSSLGRSMVEVCSDANRGGTGFTSRWTLELTNKSGSAAIALMVGQPVATIQFTEVEPPIASYKGVYQPDGELEEIKRFWGPENMLPRMRRKK